LVKKMGGKRGDGLEGYIDKSGWVKYKNREEKSGGKGRGPNQGEESEEHLALGKRPFDGVEWLLHGRTSGKEGNQGRRLSKTGGGKEKAE